jgi:hypothetical protein
MYEFDPRWPDDPRDDDRERDLSRGSRGSLDDRDHDRNVDPRDVFTIVRCSTTSLSNSARRSQMISCLLSNWEDQTAARAWQNPCSGCGSRTKRLRSASE